MMIFFTNLIDPIVKFFNWEDLANITFLSVLVRLTLAVILSGLIGVQRTSKKHAAGFRTYVLVGLGATIAMLTNQFLVQSFNTGDAARLGAQVISGIGFLGAGTILITSRSQIRGLTTAAGLWACACIGLSIGAGFYTLAILGGVIVLIVLISFSKIEYIFNNRAKTFELHVELHSRPDLKALITHFRNNHVNIFSLEHNSAYSSSGLSVYTISIEITKEANKTYKTPKDLLNDISKLPYVNYIEIIQ